MPKLVSVGDAEIEFPDEMDEQSISDFLSKQSEPEPQPDPRFMPEAAPRNPEELARSNFQRTQGIGATFPGYEGGQEYQPISEGVRQLISVSPQTVQNAGEVVRGAGIARNLQQMGIPVSAEEVMGRVAGQREVKPGTRAQIAAGLQNVGANIASSFTDPVNAAAMATGIAIPALAPAISGAFALHMGAQIPEQARAAGQASVGGTPFEQTTAYGNLATTAAFVPGLALHGTNPIRRAIPKGIEAVQEMLPGGKLLRAERMETEAWLEDSNQLKSAIETLEADPALPTDPIKQRRLAGLRATQKANGLSEAHQKIIDEQSLDSPLPVEVVWGKKGKPGQYAGIRRNADGQGEAIEFYGEAVPEYIESLARKKRGAAIKRTIDEEVIHSRTTPQDADLMAASAGKLERWVAERNYGRKVGEDGFTERDLGYEIIRQRIQRMSGETREAVEASFEDKLDMKALDIMSNAVRAIGERLVKTNAGARTRRAVGRTLRNIEDAKDAYLKENPDPDWGPAASKRKYSGGEMFDEGKLKSASGFAKMRAALDDPRVIAAADKQKLELAQREDARPGDEAGPAAVAKSKPEDLLKRRPGEVTYQEVMGLSDADAIKFFKGNQERGNSTQVDSVLAGMKLGPEALPELIELRDATHKSMMEKLQKAMESGDPESGRADVGKGVWLNGVIEGAGRKGPNYEGLRARRAEADEAPAATSKKAMERVRQQREIAALKAGQEPEKLKGPGLQAERAEVAPAERVGAVESGAMPRISGADVEKAAVQHLAGEIKGKERPSFNSFTEWARNNMQGVQPAQLRELWEDTVWKDLLNASPERLAQWRKSLGLESSYGSRSIPQPPKADKGFSLEQEVEGGKRAGAVEKRQERAVVGSRDRYRTKLVEAIALKLIGESVKDRPELSRREVTIDDIDFDNAKTEAGPYRDLSREEISDPQVLNRILRDQARASSVDPETASRRLVAVVGKDGRVELLSTYNDAGVQRVTDPTGPRVKGRPHRLLDAAFMRHYRPFAAILLVDPVQAFHQRFGSVSEFMDKIGKEASDRSKIGDYGFAGEGQGGDVVIEGTPGMRGEGGDFQGPGRAAAAAAQRGKSVTEDAGPMTDVEAGSVMDHILGEMGKIESRKDIDEAIKSLPVGASRTQLSAYRKLAAELQRRNPDDTVETLLNKLSDQIYENHIQAKTYDEFVKRTLEQAGSKPAGESAGPETAPETAQELTAPSRRRPIPGAGGPPLRGVTGEAAQRAAAEAERVSGERSEAVTREVQESPPEEPVFNKRMAESGRMREEAEAEAKTELEAESGQEDNPAAINRRRKPMARVTDAIRSTGSAYEEWMVDRIDRVGGPASQEAANKFKAIVDRAKALYGSLTPLLDPAKSAAGASKTVKVIGQVPSPERMQAMHWLNKRQNITPFAATRRVVDAMENPIRVPAYVQKVLDVAQPANLAIGRMLQPVARGFQATGKLARNITADGYDIIRQGLGTQDKPNLDWYKWTAGLSRANHYAISEVRKFFTEWKAILDVPGQDMSVLDKVNQDFVRKFPNVITDIKTGAGWKPVVHADLFNYLENAAQRAAHIRAFREQFPNTTAGKADFADLIARARAELGPSENKDLDALIRTLQGHPTDNYSSWGALSPTSPAGQAFRAFNATVGQLMAKMVLTGQMFVQPGETIIGSTPQFLGYKNYVRGLARTRQLYAQMEQQGQVNRVMYDFSFDRNSPIRSAFRIAGNTLSKTFGEQMLNELQEAAAAATANVVTERIKAGTLSPWEQRMLPETFRMMGFKESDVTAMMAGDANLLAQFQRKAAATLTSGNKAVSESSRLGANRLFNSLFRFQTYPMMKMRQFRQVSARWVEAMDSGTPTQKWSSSEQLATFMFGTALQGALTVGFTALAYQGAQGLKVRTQEAQDEPWKFLAESFLSTMSGPFYLVWRGARARGVAGYGEQATRLVFPYAVVREMTDMAQGAGQYRDLDNFDRIGKFLAQKTPGTKAIGTGLALVGLSQEDKKLDAALGGYYRWYLSEFDAQFTDSVSLDPFRTQIRKSIAALKKGDSDGFFDAYMAAAGIKAEKGMKDPKKSIASSFNARKILVNNERKPLTDEQKDKLIQRIGEEAFSRLEYFDAMLEEAGNAKFLFPYDK